MFTVPCPKRSRSKARPRRKLRVTLANVRSLVQWNQNGARNVLHTSTPPFTSLCKLNLGSGRTSPTLQWHFLPPVDIVQIDFTFMLSESIPGESCLFQSYITKLEESVVTSPLPQTSLDMPCLGHSGPLLYNTFSCMPLVIHHTRKGKCLPTTMSASLKLSRL